MTVKRGPNNVFSGLRTEAAAFVGIAPTVPGPAAGVNSKLTRSGPGARFVVTNPLALDYTEFTVVQNATGGLELLATGRLV